MIIASMMGSLIVCLGAYALGVYLYAKRVEQDWAYAPEASDLTVVEGGAHE